MVMTTEPSKLTTAAALLALLPFSPRAVKGQSFTCGSVPAVAAALRTRAIAFGTDPAFKDVRDSLGTGVVDTAQIVVVTSDSVCNLVTSGVRQAATSGPTSGALQVVVRIGTFYAATSAASERIGPIYILDDHFRLHGVVGIE